jgi:VIT1/CCC1 family predicted Fe2+/Mn2+ transporter
MSASGPLESWFHERESAWLYRHVAACEADARRKELFETLAAAAERQAVRWERTLKSVPAFSPTLRARIVAWLLHRVGPRSLRAALAAMKLRGLSVYDVSTLPGHEMPTSVEQVGLRHKSVSGGNLRAAVFGVNDGLISNTSLVLGVAGAGANPEFILTSAVAGLLAGALSMAAGEYVSVRSQREMYEYQIGLERAELAEYPEEEAEELALIYSARGMPLERAREVSRQLIAQPTHALQALAREELGLNPEDLGSPWGAAVSSFVSFALGAALPLLALLARPDPIVVALVSGCALFAVGLAISLFTGRSAWRNGLRMLAIGAAAGTATWLIGRALGVAIA